MKKHAILVGINNYSEASGFSPLKFAEKDATDLARVLETRCGFTTEVIVGTQAVYSRIMTVLQQSGAGDVLFWFFAGHGKQVGGKYRLFPFDSAASGYGSILFEDITGFCQKECNYQKVVAAVDACRNVSGARGGPVFEGLSTRDVDLTLSTGTTLEVIYGCTEGEQCWEDKSLNHGVFTYAMLDILENYAGELDTTLLSHKVNDAMRDVHGKLGLGVQQRVRRYYEPSERNRIVLLGPEISDVPSAPPEQDTPVYQLTYVTCPCCGANNQKDKTFLCRECGTDNLCKNHQDPELYICRACKEKRERKAAEELARKAKAENTGNQAQPDGGRVRPPKKGQHNFLKLLFVLGVIAVVIGAGTVLYSNHFEKNENELRAQQEPEGQTQDEAERLAREGVFGKEWKDPKTGMAFVWVPGGTFDMGDTFGDGYKDEKPVHKVTVDGFYMGKYEVTQEEWVKVMKSNPSDFKKGDRYPVENVSWDMIIKQFIPELNKISDQTYRLPTEAEWEYAARSGGKKEKYAGEDDVDALAWYDDNSNGSTHEVGTKAPNGLNLYDMSGNVWEWCEDDWHNNYDGAPDDGTAWMDSPRGADRVVRGGGWYVSAGLVRSASRRRGAPDVRGNVLGFRLVFQAVK
ncbi:SUMF1/EgtB/PvdO family nonheme iron enzyme [Desulfobacter latus]|uniref:SUMF1/EgtB/PvdO family nonheme iron enzyme n=1 Tax=Desulfobacter latus TaxID=2292 RepID=A0A850T8N8_9BACT|nr:SUMF1/EgtB/PvdO family nonheme iron enzyme [Desulfobacter latus]NWH04808.1 SUMF1/EgtB/PvdO family nonheme iron enzyme [Desulfobacter latus]